MNLEIIFITFIIFLLVALGLALGTIFSGREIKGSCGGLAALFGKGACDLCEHKDRCSDEEKNKCSGVKNP